jgi:biopolymer transport protein ExbB
MTLIQLQETVGSQLGAAQTTTPAETSSMVDMLMQGGIVMIPLVILSIVAIAIFVERFKTLQKAKTDPYLITDRTRSYVQAGDVRGAIGFCEAQNNPISRILKRGLERLGRPIAEIQDAVEAAGKYEAYELEKRTDVIASIAGIAPMLGFLGTVTGMISAFQEIQNLQGNVNPSVLAGGIWEALVTTAVGLLIGIIAILLYNYLINHINRLVNDMERSATDFIDLLQEPVPMASRSSERAY